MSDFRVLGLDHLVLRIADRERALGFYCGLLGLSVEREQAELGLIQLRAGGSLIDLVTLDGRLGRAGGAGPGAEGRNLDHFALRIEPFDEAGERYGAEGDGPSLYVQDPDGNTVELKGPARSPARRADG